MSVAAGVTEAWVIQNGIEEGTSLQRRQHVEQTDKFEDDTIGLARMSSSASRSILPQKWDVAWLRPRKRPVARKQCQSEPSTTKPKIYRGTSLMRKGPPP